MTENGEQRTGNNEEASLAFYSGALPRINRFMLVLGPAATVGVFLAVGWQFGIGFLVGCAIAYLNFHWLKQAVGALAERVSQTGQSVSGRGVFARFLLRYLLIALAAYVIFRVSVAGLYGLLAGLFLPVAAILCEAIYEGYVSFRRGL
jgi:hypothetical protein